MAYKDKQKQKEYDKKHNQDYYKKNKEKVAKQKRDYREKNKDKIAKWNKEWYEKNKDKIKEYYKKNADKLAKNRRRSQLKIRYGITLEDYEALCKKQKGKCAICSKLKKLVVDHNHKTKKNRELLCKFCNMGLGHFDEDIKTLQNSIRYLRKHNK